MQYVLIIHVINSITLYMWYVCIIQIINSIALCMWYVLPLMLHYKQFLRKYEAWDTPVRQDQETSIVLRFKPK